MVRELQSGVVVPWYQQGPNTSGMEVALIRSQAVVGLEESTTMAITTRSHRRSPLGRLWSFIRRQPPQDEDLVFLTRREVHELLDRLAKRDFGMTAEQFLVAVDQGELRESPLAQQLLVIAGERPGSEQRRGTAPV